MRHNQSTQAGLTPSTRTAPSNAAQTQDVLLRHRRDVKNNDTHLFTEFENAISRPIG